MLFKKLFRSSNQEPSDDDWSLDWGGIPMSSEEPEVQQVQEQPPFPALTAQEWEDVRENLAAQYADASCVQVEIGFLKTAVLYDPSGCGEDRHWFFNKKRRAFYSEIRHWDAGNFRAEWTYDRKSVTRAELDAALKRFRDERLPVNSVEDTPENIRAAYDRLCAMLRQW